MQVENNKTKLTIINAFERLLSTNALEKITITEIAEEAQYSRHTIYNHFEDKQEIIEFLFFTYAAKVSLAFYNGDGFFSYIHNTLKFFFDNQLTFSKIIHEIMISISSSRKTFLKDFEDILATFDIPSNLADQFLIYFWSLSYIIKNWSDNHFEMPCADVLKKLTLALPYPLARLIYEKEKEQWPEEIPTPC